MAAIAKSDTDSEFGYDFTAEEEELLLQLGSDPIPSSAGAIDVVPEQTNIIVPPDDAANIAKYGLASPTLQDFVPKPPPPETVMEGVSIATESIALPSPVSDSSEVSYPNLAAKIKDITVKEESPKPKMSRKEEEDDEAYKDDRSPLKRFRTFPKKPLTVTDLTGGAWCELQYWYTLTRLPYGRRTRTAAMTKGVVMHKKLEDEVHRAVQIEVLTKEDGFGLRFWNVIQGLRTLRETGLTREIEVWGIFDGNVVNGIIDSLSYKNPNPEFEEELSSQESKKQSVLTDFFESKKPKEETEKHPLIYLADTKTRGSLAPITPALVRPAKIQLHLYHQMVSQMASGTVDYIKVARRYGLDLDDTFSDSFIAQIAGIHDDMFEEVVQNPNQTPEDDTEEPRSDILKYRTLRELLVLLEEELKLTFPKGAESVGKMLRLEYIHRDDGRTLHLHDFPLATSPFEEYLGSYLRWWKGERKAKGVDMEEAFKCRGCEFADDCTWRQDIDEGAVKKAQDKVLAKRKTSGSA